MLSTHPHRVLSHASSEPDASRAAIQLEQSLIAPALEFLSRPSKGFRARLVELSYALSGGLGKEPPRAAIELVEMLHAGSLVIDDIEDDAELRRGAPALHRSLGLPRALNLGNWLYFVAISRIEDMGLTDASLLTMLRSTQACLLRCHEGQALDLSTRIDDVEQDEVRSLCLSISARKTAALMGLACEAGARAAGANDDKVRVLCRFGERLGLALQMLDDVSGVLNPARRDKGLEDLRERRLSWAWVFAADALSAGPFRKLVAHSSDPDEQAQVLEALAPHALSRGKPEIRGVLTRAQMELSQAFGEGPLLSIVREELSRLEHGYG